MLLKIVHQPKYHSDSDIKNRFMNFSRLFTLLSLFFSVSVKGQDLPIGSWRVHLPYLKGSKVADAGDKIYCVADKGLFYYQKTDASINRLSKVEGLSDNEINVVRYNNQHGVLLIAYKNANIDLLYDNNELVNLADILRAGITGNTKTINEVLFRDQYAYLSCGFGIVVIDIVKKEVKESYFLGSTGTNPAIYDLCLDNQQQIYAASDSGVYSASLTNPNLNDYASWTKIYTGKGIFNHVLFFGNRLVINQHSLTGGEDTIWTNQSGIWGFFTSNNGATNSINEFNGKLINTYSYYTRLYDQQFQQIQEITINNYNSIPYPKDGLIDADNIIWLADEAKGLVRYDGNNPPDFIFPNGPKSELVSGFAASGDYLWVSHGPVESGGILQNQFRRGVISSYRTGTWQSLFKENTDNTICNMDSIIDLTCIVADPGDADHVYAGSYNRGVLEFNDGRLTALYNKDNTGGALGYINLTNYIRVGGMALDNNNQLWVGMGEIGNILSVKKTDGTWKTFSFSGTLKTTDYLGQMLIDDNNQKWCINVNKNDRGGIFVFNDNNTPDDLSDDNYRLLLAQSGYGGLPEKDVRAIAKDLDGAIWVGTAKGVAVYYSPSGLFAGGNFDAQQILIQYDGYNQYLLESEIVTAIAIDGANRKWFGTQSGGVFLMSADGTKQLANFNITNSPLLSNTILRISINKTTGEIFFGTDKGIISYRGTATEGEEGCTGTYVFPNPVPEDYHGLIAVNGLAANSSVKITDISGTVIYETKADGGQATWNGYSLNGKKAHSGVYLVYCSDENGKNTCVTKMVFVN